MWIVDKIFHVVYALPLSLTRRRIQAIFEPLFEKYRADIYICGHVHAMERSFPVSQDVIRFNGNGNIRDSAINHGDDGAGKNALPPITRSMVYDDPTATVHLVSGAGGNIEVRRCCTILCIFPLFSRLVRGSTERQ